MRNGRSLLGVGLGFLLAVAVVAGTSLFGPTVPARSTTAPKQALAQASSAGGAAATSKPVGPTVNATPVSPSSVEAISGTTPSSLLIVLLPIAIAVVLGMAANRLYSRRIESE